jgi:hypothetical protein
MPGCPMHPQPVCKKTHTVVATGSPGSTGIPCAMVLTAYSALSPATSSFLSPSSANWRLCETRSGPQNLRRLDTSNGCQDHTASPSATRLRQEASACVHIHRSVGEHRSIAVRLRAVIRSRAKSPPCDYVCAPGAAASTASHPNVRDDGQRPSLGTG